MPHNRANYHGQLDAMNRRRDESRLYKGRLQGVALFGAARRGRDESRLYRGDFERYLNSIKSMIER